MIKEYTPKPFPKDLFKPLEWTHILAILDVCTNKITQMQLCDKDGNDIIPLCIVELCLNESSLTLDEKPYIIKIEFP